MLVPLALATNRKWTPKESNCIPGERHRCNWNPLHLVVGRSDPPEQLLADTKPETPEPDQRRVLVHSDELMCSNSSRPLEEHIQQSAVFSCFFVNPLSKLVQNLFCTVWASSEPIRCGDFLSLWPFSCDAVTGSVSWLVLFLTMFFR